MPRDSRPNFEPITDPAGQPAKEPPYEGGELADAAGSYKEATLSD